MYKIILGGVSENDGVKLMTKKQNKLEALGERRPPWPRQIITPIFPNVIMLSLGGETPKGLNHYLYHDLGMLPLLLFFCTFTHLRISRSPPKYNQFFIVLPRDPSENFITMRS